MLRSSSNDSISSNFVSGPPALAQALMGYDHPNEVGTAFELRSSPLARKNEATYEPNGDSQIDEMAKSLSALGREGTSSGGIYHVSRDQSTASDATAAKAGSSKALCGVQKSKNSPAGKTPRSGAAKEKKRGLEILDPTGVLPPGHRPARGRGRQVQLKTMTKAQIQAEAEARLERNRQAARDCRQRRKEHVSLLEDKVEKLEREKADSAKMISKLELRIAELEAATNLARNIRFSFSS